MEKRVDGADTSVLFFRLAVQFFASVHASTDFLHFAVKIDIKDVNLINVTLACEDANSKLVEVLIVAHVDAEDHVGNSLLQILTVAHVDAEDYVGNSLLQILKLRFGHEVKFCSDFKHRVGKNFEVEVRLSRF